MSAGDDTALLKSAVSAACIEIIPSLLYLEKFYGNYYDGS